MAPAKGKASTRSSGAAAARKSMAKTPMTKASSKGKARTKPGSSRSNVKSIKRRSDAADLDNQMDSDRDQESSQGEEEEEEEFQDPDMTIDVDEEDEDEDKGNGQGQEGQGKRRTLTADNPAMGFLAKMDAKVLNLTKKEVEKKQRKEKRLQREELDEARKRLEDMREGDEDDDEGMESLEDMDGLEEDEILDSGSDFEEHDVSEGEEVSVDGQDEDRDHFSEDDLEAMGSPKYESFEEEEAPVSAKGKKQKEATQEDAEEAHLTKLTKRKAREELDEEERRRKRKGERLPVRTADGKIQKVTVSESEDSDRDDGDDSEGEGLSDEEEAPKAKRSRAVHAPLDIQDPTDASDSERQSQQQQQQHQGSSMVFSTRFNLTAPYDILCMGLPRVQPVAKGKGKAKGKIKAKARVDPADRTRMLALARNQIASLASQIVADPEVSLNLLRRLAVFAGKKVQAPPEKVSEIKRELAKFKQDEEEAKAKGLEFLKQPPPSLNIDVDPAVRQLAIVSLLAVFVDIIPGYRIRALGEKEAQEKVGQEVARRREFEAGLVNSYREFLEMCESELRDRNSPLTSAALRTFTTLLTRATHFNYRNNILRTVIARLSRRQWGQDEEMCFSAVVEILRRDASGEVSLEVVRLIHRMIKERRFKVNARVLNILLELRLKDELGNKRASTVTAEDPEASRKEQERLREEKLRHKRGKDKVKPKDVRKGRGEHLSKKAVKKMKEIKAIEDEMKEAEATVDLEERERNQTETLKLLFVLYFTILKSPIGSVPLPLLGSALGGLGRFAHRVNVDFFRDLLNVLRQHVVEARKRSATLTDAMKGFSGLGVDGGNNAEEEEEEEDHESLDVDKAQQGLRHALLCLATAFELLHGQGEALNIDLSDFVGHLYALLLPLAVSPNMELDPTQNGSVATRKPTATKGQDPRNGQKQQADRVTNADYLFRSLDLVLLFPPTRSIPAERLASFIKRLMTCCLSWPPNSVIRSLRLVSKLIGRDDRLEALLDTSDRAKDGRFDSTGDNPDSARPLAAGVALWELELVKKLGNDEVSSLVERIRGIAKR
ncbi:hypothetical protein IE53DRAFT_411247 [Violaceomyces palustris]|uniref:Uncharacterized protein n=1 Tax=Violaceomyces palustris TaxID=1673888 RepID=A0ACD0NW11_9BASI|nr:hypothetical protein IE53DRAFT_411247 [Violaceomyces palustris]